VRSFLRYGKRIRITCRRRVGRRTIRCRSASNVENVGRFSPCEEAASAQAERNHDIEQRAGIKGCGQPIRTQNERPEAAAALIDCPRSLIKDMLASDNAISSAAAD
jgi:hypothetical protein